MVLSDHGQSQGTTFEDRYGCSLGELARAAMHAGRVSEIGAARVAGEESWGYASDQRDAGQQRAVLTEGTAPGPARRAHETSLAAGPGEAVVLASGNLGLIYLTEQAERMSLETIGKRYPDLVPAHAGHPGIGFVLVRSDELGPVVMGSDGLHALQTQIVRGADPLQPFGASAPWQVLQTDSCVWPAAATMSSPMRAPGSPPTARATHCLLVVSQTADPRSQRRAREEKIFT